MSKGVPTALPNNLQECKADRSSGLPSTSGSGSEMASEDEVVRLLSCTDHYTALGLSRFENIDVSIMKREYRKKAMLVYPDKDMGNEKAADAFRKLQNAYEVLLYSSKRKEYDDELRREELLIYFRKLQCASHEEVWLFPCLDLYQEIEIQSKMVPGFSQHMENKYFCAGTRRKGILDCY